MEKIKLAEATSAGSLSLHERLGITEARMQEFASIFDGDNLNKLVDEKYPDVEAPGLAEMVSTIQDYCETQEEFVAVLVAVVSTSTAFKVCIETLGPVVGLAMFEANYSSI